MIPTMTTAKITDLPRNDVARALAYVKNKLEQNSRISDDDMHTLLMLQDDADALIALLQKLNDERRTAGLATFL